MYPSADQIGYEIAPILDGNPLDSRFDLEQFASELRRGPAAEGGHVDLVWIGFGIGDELGNGFCRKRWINHDDTGQTTDAGDWRNVPSEIKTQFFKQRSVDRVRPRRQ